MMEILYHDKDIVVCVKPPRVLSTDEPGGVPQLVRQALGEENIRTVHRLDRVVGGLMVLAKRAKEFNDGTSWVGVPVPIDFEQLKADCQIKSLDVNPVLSYPVRKAVGLIMRIRRARPQRFQVEIIPTEAPCTLD